MGSFFRLSDLNQQINHQVKEKLHMYHSIRLTIPIPSVRTSTNRPLRQRGLFSTALALALAWFALSPTAGAVTPPPDGGYPNQNTAEGDNALFSLTTGANNTASGFDALLHNTTGFNNTATGVSALLSNTTGANNTANGLQTLFHNTTGFTNTANGVSALQNNTTGSNNTATGVSALLNNTNGANNTATGLQSLLDNTAGGENTANGVNALQNNSTGNDNTASGVSALFLNSFGSANTATGVSALYRNTLGNNNTATGRSALNFNTIGEGNTAIGATALDQNDTGVNNTASGFQALYLNITGDNNIALGFNAGYNTTGSNNIEIGNSGVAGEGQTIRIGSAGTQSATFIAGISGKTIAGGVTVIIDANGHLGTVVSSERFKDAIQPMDKTSEAILALHPVTFRYKHELDPAGIPQFGLVAEQVEKVDPDLVARDGQGKAYTVRYEAVNAMLLNEFLKEHRKVEIQYRKMQEQEAAITRLKSAGAKQEVAIAQQKNDFQSVLAEQQKEIKALTAALKEQAFQIQKVSARLAADKAAPRLVGNNR
jgi:hypothetical protein